ncbi:MAG: SGNH/GDSL hydrolase family protein [Chitinophagales bacterium]
MLKQKSTTRPLRKKLLFSAIIATIMFSLVIAISETYFFLFPFTSPNSIRDSYYNKQRWLQNKTGASEILYQKHDTFDSRYGWNSIPFADVSMHEIERHYYTVTTNARGERATDTLPYFKTKKKRIVFLGDSYTFGECVNNNETFAYVTDSLLEDYEVVNLGIHGYGTDQQYLKLINEGLKYKPDIVILGGVSADLPRNNLWFRDYLKPYFTHKNGQLTLHNAHIESPEKYIKRFNLRTLNFLLSNYSLHINNNIANPNTGMAILKAISDTCKAQNIRFMILYLSEGSGDFLNNEYEESFAGGEWKTFCKNENIDFIHPYCAISEAIAITNKPINHYFECHYSAEVHYAIGKKIAEHIKYNY